MAKNSKIKTVYLTRNTFIEGELAKIGEKLNLPEKTANLLILMGKASTDQVKAKEAKAAAEKAAAPAKG